VVTRRQPIGLVELDDGARRMIARRHPEIARRGKVFALGASPDVEALLLRALEQLVDIVNRGRRLRLERLVESLLPPMRIPDARDLEDARRLAVLRSRIVDDFGVITSEEVGRRAGSRAAKRSRIAYHWRSRRRIFAVPYQGKLVYPSFQFDDEGQPFPVVRGVLTALRAWEPWDVAAWFVMANPRLERARPVELLGREGEALLVQTAILDDSA
jgi:hypothetical protein